MFETFGFESVTPLQASVVLGLAIGVVYGLLAQRSRFCLRRGVTGAWKDCLPALGTWVMALATAIAGTQLAIVADLISLETHRFLAHQLPVLAIVAGGAMFGAGMACSGGCISRLAVLAGTGNLRSMVVLIVLAIAAHATMKGAFAPVRTVLGSVSLDLGGVVSLTEFPAGQILIWAVALVAAVFAWRSRAPAGHLVMAALIGLLVPLGWIGTGFLLLDDFDPIPLESLGYTGSMATTLFWLVAASAVPAGFGTGLIAGTLAGSLVAAVMSSEFEWKGFDNPGRTGRYLSGGILMGVGGVLAGGCSVGAGLSGVSTASLAAILALASMAISARMAGRYFSGEPGRLD